MSRQDEYYQWLLGIIDIDSHTDYYLLLGTLHRREYRYSVAMDANRAAEGIELRKDWFDDIHDHDYHYAKFDINTPCSVLEMLIALAISIEDKIMYKPNEDHTAEWFWMMIDNLKLSNMTDDNFDLDAVCDAIDIFLDRKYGPDGKGSVFYTNRTDIDFRKMELWYQMSHYLDEHYSCEVEDWVE